MAFQQRSAELSSGAVQYWAGGGGKGRPLLYLHSAGGLRIGKALEGLARDFQIYAPELPGFNGMPKHDGVTHKRDLAKLAAEFAEKVIKERCDVIGHSFGGHVATWLAADHPKIVDQLVLEAPAGFRVGGAGGLGGTPEELRRRMFAHPENLPPETRSPEIVAKNREVAGSYGPAEPVDQLLVDKLGGIESLTVILYGTADGVIPVEGMRLIKSKLKHGHLLYVFDAAHNIEIDQPQRFVSLVGDFLTRGESFLVNPGAEASAA